MRVALVVLVVLVLCGCERGSTHSGTGEVIALDAAAPSITLRHDDIPGLMGAMTMTYQVANREVLGRLKTGDQITASVRSEDFQHLYGVAIAR